MALANVVLAFMQVFLDQGFAQALIQRKTLEPAHINTSFWTNLALGVGLSLVSFAAAELVADSLKQPQLAPVLQGLSLLFVINALRGTQQALLERQFAFKAIAVRELLGTVVGGGVGVTMAFLGWGVWSLIAQQILHELLGTFSAMASQ